jgi:hypothetical protein
MFDRTSHDFRYRFETASSKTEQIVPVARQSIRLTGTRLCRDLTGDSAQPFCALATFAIIMPSRR